MADLLRRLREHPRRANTQKWLESMFSLGGMTALQLGGFILLARILGANDYAVVVGVASVVAMLIELVGLGSGDALIRSVSRDPETFKLMAGRALALMLLTLLPVAALGYAVVAIFYQLDVPWHIPAALVLSELVSARSIAFVEHMSIAHHRVRLANFYRVTPQAIRFALIAAAFAAHLHSIGQWWVWQFAFGMMVPPLCVAHALSRFGIPRLTLRGITVGDNFFFALTQQLRAMQFNIDRLFVGSLGTQLMLGQYGVAARLVQYSLLPLTSVLRITYPHYFLHGREGIGSAYRYGLKVLLILLGVALPVTLFLFFAAPLIAQLLGRDFAPVATYLKLLSPIPLLVAVQYAMADVLTGADRQKVRTATLALGVTAIAGSAWLGGRLLGISGIPIGVVAANAILALALFTIVRRRAGEVRA